MTQLSECRNKIRTICHEHGHTPCFLWRWSRPVGRAGRRRQQTTARCRRSSHTTCHRRPCADWPSETRLRPPGTEEDVETDMRFENRKKYYLIFIHHTTLSWAKKLSYFSLYCFIIGAAETSTAKGRNNKNYSLPYAFDKSTSCTHWFNCIRPWLNTVPRMLNWIK